jgi:hypothetical protein
MELQSLKDIHVFSFAILIFIRTMKVNAESETHFCPKLSYVEKRKAQQSWAKTITINTGHPSQI